MSPVQLTLSSERSRHACADATCLASSLRLRQWHHQKRQKKDIAVSRRHSLPQGTGTFLAASRGSKLPVCALRSRASPASFDISCKKPHNLTDFIFTSSSSGFLCSCHLGRLSPCVVVMVFNVLSCSLSPLWSGRSWNDDACSKAR